jgi:hypothetical protein
MSDPSRTLAAHVAVLASLAFAGCSIDVKNGDHGRRADVDIRAFGNAVKVHTDVPAEGTGLSVYPGARVSREHDRAESANVDVRGWFGLGVKVVAAKFESDDEPDRIRDFYRDELEKYGPVTVCHGDVDFRRRDGVRRAVCKDRDSDTLKMVAGVAENQRIVTIEPDGDGTEFALVYVRTGS